ncbi:thioredoxin family protein [Spirochaeta isovalerica]|uniref:Protein disulfide-isomerase n=1 Tax=Spirochaeta isovalerica TaxID=150 RepID=A0A841RAJ1_9SPIO|nr:thioredoxin family protein [Spirochaeta isovalerica]MBB6480933.1 protein disulfide-isomerase [Spirochaeta isovalerica]
MKKTILVISFIMIISSYLTAEAYPPENWNPSLVNAAQQASEENKYLLLNFTGSDWCIWCTRLRDQVFSTDDFKDWADENAVLVYLDFPSERELPQNQITHNSYLQQFLGVKGYPSIWLFDNDFTPLLVTGYREGGSEKYITHLENDRLDIEADQISQFKVQMKDFIETYLKPLNVTP